VSESFDEQLQRLRIIVAVGPTDIPWQMTVETHAALAELLRRWDADQGTLQQWSESFRSLSKTLAGALALLAQVSEQRDRLIAFAKAQQDQNPS
jgi:hypothetical protein